MVKLTLLFLLLTIAVNGWANSAKVLVLRGKASFGGYPLALNAKMEGKGKIVVEDKSYLKILLEESKTVIALAANSTSEINFSLPSEKQELNLIKGISRWVTGEKKGLGVRTPNAAMGVRGTDFYVSYFPETNESELMCFSGTVIMKNVNNPKDYKVVTDSQWGGIGGQFGDAVTEIKTLTKEVLSKFDKAIPKN